MRGSKPIKYNGIELKENTTLQVFDPMLVWDNDLMATVMLLDTEVGKMANILLKKAGPDAFRAAPVGIGNMANNVAKEDYNLITFNLKPR